MYEEYGFTHFKTQKNFSYEYEIYFIKKIEKNNILTNKE